MKYCSQCGTKLIMKANGIDGKVPYCPKCQEFRFFKFSSAISAIIFNPQKTKILLLQQYGRLEYILLSGYINRGENAKQALLREVMEETQLPVASYSYNDNAYYKPHDVLMHNYAVVVASENVQANKEIDHYVWVPVSEAVGKIAPGSLAQAFVKEWLEKGHIKG